MRPEISRQDLIEQRAARLVKGADEQMKGWPDLSSPEAIKKGLNSNRMVKVKVRHLAALREALNRKPKEEHHVQSSDVDDGRGLIFPLR